MNSNFGPHTSYEGGTPYISCSLIAWDVPPPPTWDVPRSNQPKHSPVSIPKVTARIREPGHQQGVVIQFPGKNPCSKKRDPM